MRKEEYQIKTGLYTIEDIVKDILIGDIFAREDDYYLTFKVMQRIAPEDLMKTYRDYLLQQHKIVSFKSIERARRKVQSKYPELQASGKKQEARKTYENAYTEYAIEGNHIPRIDYNIGE